MSISLVWSIKNVKVNYKKKVSWTPLPESTKTPTNPVTETQSTSTVKYLDKPLNDKLLIV